MPMSVFVCVRVCEDHRCDGGRGSLRFKPWNRLTGAFPLWSAGCVRAAWNKELAPGECPRDHHLHKTPSHTMSSCLCLAHTSAPQIYLLKSKRLLLKAHPHRHLTSSTRNKLTAKGTFYEYGQQMLIIKYLQIHYSIFSTCLTYKMCWLYTFSQCKQCQLIRINT